MWSSAIKRGTLRGVTKFENASHCNKHYFLHTLNIAMCGITQKQQVLLWLCLV